MLRRGSGIGASRRTVLQRALRQRARSASSPGPSSSQRSISSSTPTPPGRTARDVAHEPRFDVQHPHRAGSVPVGTSPASSLTNLNQSDHDDVQPYAVTCAVSISRSEPVARQRLVSIGQEAVPCGHARRRPGAAPARCADGTNRRPPRARRPAAHRARTRRAASAPRSAIRRALDGLEQDGLVVRHVGRGTFLADAAPRRRRRARPTPARPRSCRSGCCSNPRSPRWPPGSPIRPISTASTDCLNRGGASPDYDGVRGLGLRAPPRDRPGRAQRPALTCSTP